MRRRLRLISVGSFNSRATASLMAALCALMAAGASNTALAQSAGFSRTRVPAHVQIASPHALPLSARGKELPRVVVVASY
jgi:hypothetical protein